MRYRLSAMMFLVYAGPGAVQPVFSLWLQQLGFDAFQTGFICATQAVAALVAPLLIGQVADRWWAADRCLAVCGGVAALVLWALAGSTSPAAVFAAYLAFWLMQCSIMLLGTTVAFANLSDPARDFGAVRVWGTVGWVAAGGGLGGWRWLVAETSLTDAVRLGAVCCLALSVYSLTLPNTPPSPGKSRRAAPLAAVMLLRDRSFGTYCACLLLVSVSYPFFQQLTPLLLDRLRIPPVWLTPALTVGQALEFPGLALLPVSLVLLGVRRTMLFGLAGWVAGLAMLTYGRPLWVVVLAESSWGLCISCFLVAGQVFINRRARPDIRASAQALHLWVNGVGMLIGNPLVGECRRLTGDDFVLTYAVALGAAALSAVVFWVGFVDEKEIEPG